MDPAVTMISWPKTGSRVAPVSKLFSKLFPKTFSKLFQTLWKKILWNFFFLKIMVQPPGRFNQSKLSNLPPL